jgi:hypothetical protein
MAAEVRYVLDVDDILAVQLDCSACHVRNSFPLITLPRMQYGRPHRHADWALPQTAEEKAISTFLLGLGEYGDRRDAHWIFVTWKMGNVPAPVFLRI